MSAQAGTGRRRLAVPSVLARVWGGVTAVGIKELRGRMRGRRAFAVLTIYLLLLGAFAFGIYQYLREAFAFQASFAPAFRGDDFGPAWRHSFVDGAGGTAVSATIGHAIFSGLLILETLLVLVLAPAFTTGAISLEREKQTIDLLVTTPLSTIGMVLGKLLSALTYVFLLIIASIPFASLVFAFGGVGPEDLVRGYAFLFALAFGMGAIGLFVSALVRRTQTATVLTYVLVLVLTVGTAVVHQYLAATSRDDRSSFMTARHGAPEPLLWLNPFVADMDLVCTTAPDAYHGTCAFMSYVTGTPYFGDELFAGQSRAQMEIAECDGENGCVDEDGLRWGIDAGGRDFVVSCPPGVECVDVPAGAPPLQQSVATFGFPRDIFWPKSAFAFVAVGVVLTFLSAQLVSPTRRLRLWRPRRPRGAQPLPAAE